MKYGVGSKKSRVDPGPTLFLNVSFVVKTPPSPPPWPALSPSFPPFIATPGLVHGSAGHNHAARMVRQPGPAAPSRRSLFLNVSFVVKKPRHSPALPKPSPNHAYIIGLKPPHKRSGIFCPFHRENAPVGRVASLSAKLRPTLARPAVGQIASPLFLNVSFVVENFVLPGLLQRRLDGGPGIDGRATGGPVERGGSIPP